MAALIAFHCLLSAENLSQLLCLTKIVIMVRIYFLVVRMSACIQRGHRFSEKSHTAARMAADLEFCFIGSCMCFFLTRMFSLSRYFMEYQRFKPLFNPPLHPVNM